MDKTRTAGSRNVVLLGVGFAVIFAAFSATQNLMTKVHGRDGFTSLSILYFVFGISTLFVSVFVRAAGAKEAMLYGGVTYVLYIASNISYDKVVYYIASGLLGIGAAALWTANGSYISNEAGERGVEELSGVFFSIFQSNQIAGNTLAAFILGSQYSDSIFAILTVISVFGLAFLFIIPRQPKNTVKDVKILDKLLMTWRLATDFKRKMPLLIPVMIYSGLSLGVFFGAINSYLEKDWIPILMTGFGASDVVGSYLNGKILKHVEKHTMFIVGFALTATGVALCHAPVSGLGIEFWRVDPSFVPEQDSFWRFIAGMCFFGLSDGVYNTTIYSTIGTVYKDQVEEAFGVFRFTQSLAISASMAYSKEVSLNGNYVIIIIAQIVGILTSSGLRSREDDGKGAHESVTSSIEVEQFCSD